jgi:hypothetical protein
MTKHQKTEILKPETIAARSPDMLAQLESDVAALAAEARDLADDIRVGDDLRFTKGKWHKIAGKDDINIGTTTPFVVDTRGYWRGWIKWVDKKPVQKLVARPIDGWVSPKRFELPDRDKSKWPVANKDPWQETLYIVMRDLSDDRLCTLTITSYYGAKALGALLKVYTREAKHHPGLMPVVLLSSEIKETIDYGDVDAPVFTVVDWKAFGDGAAPPGNPKTPLPVLPKTQELLPPPSKPIGDDMSDEIPF